MKKLLTTTSVLAFLSVAAVFTQPASAGKDIDDLDRAAKTYAVAPKKSEAIIEVAKTFAAALNGIVRNLPLGEGAVPDILSEGGAIQVIRVVSIDHQNLGSDAGTMGCKVEFVDRHKEKEVEVYAWIDARIATVRVQACLPYGDLSAQFRSRLENDQEFQGSFFNPDGVHARLVLGERDAAAGQLDEPDADADAGGGAAAGQLDEPDAAFRELGQEMEAAVARRFGATTEAQVEREIATAVTTRLASISPAHITPISTRLAQQQKDAEAQAAAIRSKIDADQILTAAKRNVALTLRKLELESGVRPSEDDVKTANREVLSLMSSHLQKERETSTAMAEPERRTADASRQRWAAPQFQARMRALPGVIPAIEAARAAARSAAEALAELHVLNLEANLLQQLKARNVALESECAALIEKQSGLGAGRAEASKRTAEQQRLAEGVAAARLRAQQRVEGSDAAAASSSSQVRGAAAASASRSAASFQRGVAPASASRSVRETEEARRLAEQDQELQKLRALYAEARALLDSQSASSARK